MFLAIGQHIYLRGINTAELKHVTDLGDSISESIVKAMQGDKDRFIIGGISKEGKALSNTDIIFWKKKESASIGEELFEINKAGDLKKIGDNYDTSG